MYDAASDRFKLTDFGIARLTDASRTRTGIILGTPSYMSPEQLSASKVSGQTDLYSLGATMYHLLTGAPPFQADSIPRLMDKIVHDRPRPVADLRDDVPAGGDVILERAMAKNPADRYESGKAMALALREFCSTFPSEIL
jgi:serine/threonine-protein kinase